MKTQLCRTLLSNFLFLLLILSSFLLASLQTAHAWMAPSVFIGMLSAIEKQKGIEFSEQTVSKLVSKNTTSSLLKRGSCIVRADYEPTSQELFNLGYVAGFERDMADKFLSLLENQGDLFQEGTDASLDTLKIADPKSLPAAMQAKLQQNGCHSAHLTDYKSGVAQAFSGHRQSQTVKEMSERAPACGEQLMASRASDNPAATHAYACCYFGYRAAEELADEKITEMVTKASIEDPVEYQCRGDHFHGWQHAMINCHKLSKVCRRLNNRTIFFESCFSHGFREAQELCNNDEYDADTLASIADNMGLKGLREEESSISNKPGHTSPSANRPGGELVGDCDEFGCRPYYGANGDIEAN